MLEREGRAARPRDRLRRRRLQRDRHLRGLRRRRGRRARSASRPAGEGLDSGRHGAPLTVGGRAGRAARLALGACCRTRTARSSRRTRSRPGSTTRASGPSTRTCATSAAPATWRSPTTRRWRRSGDVARLEGIIPALESAHALACALASRPDARARPRLPAPGRGDKDLAEVLARPTRDDDASATGAQAHRRGLRRARQARGADAVPDGRLPDLDDVAAHRRGLRRRRAPT